MRAWIDFALPPCARLRDTGITFHVKRILPVDCLFHVKHTSRRNG